MLKCILSQSWKRGAHMLHAGNSAPAVLTCWSQFHSGQVTQITNMNDESLTYIDCISLLLMSQVTDPVADKVLDYVSVFQVWSSSRSFFGVEDFVDEDNSRPYTYKKEKRSKNPHKHISFKQRTIAHMEPFTLDVFISKRFVSASLTHRSTCRQVAVAGTNSKDIKAALRSRSDVPACLAVGRFLAERAKEADVYTCTYTPRERDKFEGKIRAVVQSLIDNGINVKLYLD
ncbi:Ribosomal L18p/L5e family protein [Zea mays]|uniref:Ribosomal L18p/L5e family protein n=1 Tax=Zea mays TaxID=4577 RepID=A0A1D6K8A9_MAIZE|nr:Ribosomal L18p/L5e family protein [Zea mays]